MMDGLGNLLMEFGIRLFSLKVEQLKQQFKEEYRKSEKHEKVLELKENEIHDIIVDN